MAMRNIFFILLLLSIQGRSVAPTTILFFGDSLTAGYGISPTDAFPALVEKALLKDGKKCTVINAGLSGETSAGGLARIDWILKQPVDIFILELGANDGLRGLPVEQTKKNLQAIINKVKAKNPNVKIVLAGMMVPPNIGPEYAENFKQIFPALATKNKAALIPFLLEGVAGDDKLNQPDRIHPTAAGHKIVAQNVLKVMTKLM